MESWQPCPMKSELLAEAQRMASLVTASLGGSGIWGIEFFIGFGFRNFLRVRMTLVW